jgi:hypothetical protein
LGFEKHAYQGLPPTDISPRIARQKRCAQRYSSHSSSSSTERAAATEQSVAATNCATVLAGFCLASRRISSRLVGGMFSASFVATHRQLSSSDRFIISMMYLIWTLSAHKVQFRDRPFRDNVAPDALMLVLSVCVAAVLLTSELRGILARTVIRHSPTLCVRS